MKKMTEQSLKDAFAGESQAHIKYLAFAERAERDGLATIARLFRAASFAELTHATAHLRTLSGIGTTAENLAAAFGGETFEVDEMYAAYLAIAREQQEPKAERSFQRAMDAEKVHAELYSRAQRAVELGRDTEMGPVVVCSVCGYTGEGEIPDVCPYCGARHDKFVKF
ncbi:MAG TPA: rubrerythrin family protein [Chloroflexota bacterium]